MLDPVKNILSQVLDQGVILVPIVLGVCVMVYGLVMAMGDHSKGRNGLIWAFIGGAVALGSKTIAAAVKP